MRLLSSQVRYAICGMFDLAYNSGPEPIQLRTIGERQQIPPRYLEQIFQRLRKAGLVHGKRGPGGGYVLQRAAREISLLDIIEAVDGPIDFSQSRRAAVNPPAASDAEPRESARPEFLWPQLASRISQSLAETTLEDLSREAARRGIRRPAEDYLSYQI